VPTGGAIAGPSGASVGGAAIGHIVDREQNGGMSLTEVHSGCMRPLTHRHTQLASAFSVGTTISTIAMKQKTRMVLTPLAKRPREDCS